MQDLDSVSEWSKELVLRSNTFCAWVRTPPLSSPFFFPYGLHGLGYRPFKPEDRVRYPVWEICYPRSLVAGYRSKQKYSNRRPRFESWRGQHLSLERLKMLGGAGEARWAHNPKVVGSKPTRAMTFVNHTMKTIFS